MFEKPENITEKKNTVETKLSQVGFKLTTTAICADGLAN